MPLTTREKWAIGGTVAAVATAVVVGVVVSKSASASTTTTPPPPQPIGNKNVSPGQIVQKQPPPQQQQTPPGGKVPAHHGLNPNYINPPPPPGPPQASNDPQTFNVIAGGTYQTNPAPGGTLLTINMPVGSHAIQAAVGPGLKLGSQTLTGRQFFAILDGSPGEVSVKWGTPNGGVGSATLNIVGV